jgi:HD superfamily phosphohydrolase
MSNKEKPLLVRDIIHGDMYFDFPLELVIDHVLFQRLKFIVQNGICYQVFPGMTHTRFQHSMGVCHLAIKWFDFLFKEKRTEEFLKKMTKNCESKPISDGYEISTKETLDCYEYIGSDCEKWKTLISIAALCHDLGHGPFSHLLEEAKFIPSESIVSDYENAFSSEKVNSILNTFLKGKYIKEDQKVEHEDITLMYLATIFKDLEGNHSVFSNDNFKIAAALISKDFQNFINNPKGQSKLNESDAKAVILLSSMTSGFIDVDRLDYVVRDSRMAGVHIGGVEIHKITNSLIPTLFKNKGNNKFKNGFLTRYKYHHVVDNFFFSLYQVYTQVIFHPRALQLNHELTQIFEKYKTYFNSRAVKENFITWHKRTNDLLFIDQLRENRFDPSTSYKVIDKVLNRHEDYKSVNNLKTVYSFPKETPNITKTVGENYSPLETHKREMIKDGSIIWLFNQIGDDFEFYSWTKSSIIASELKAHSFKPNIYWKNEKFLDDLKVLITTTNSEDENELDQASS